MCFWRLQSEVSRAEDPLVVLLPAYPQSMVLLLLILANGAAKVRSVLMIVLSSLEKLHGQEV
jgi:hypothetical protein